MLLEKDTTLQENKTEGNRSNEIMLKLLATQNVMKNKFKNAYANRLEREYNLNQSIKPLITSSLPLSSINDSESTEKNDSLRNLSKIKNVAQQLRLATKSYSNHVIAIKPRPMIAKTRTKIDDKKNNIENNIHNCFDDPNKLCNRIRFLISSQNDGYTNNVEEINDIITKLRKLEIIV